jgi:methylated-DNA-protein-cysteine methyltransferase related protein
MGLSKPKDTPPLNSPLYESIYGLVRQIPEGQVATYGQIAELLGLYRRARMIGYALFRVAPESDVPWQRVVNAKGMVSRSPLRQGSDELQRILLEQEGVVFDAQDCIDLKRFRWTPNLNGEGDCGVVKGSTPSDF